MLAAVVEHLSERSELCGAIANKRMYEIRKRSVFSKHGTHPIASFNLIFFVPHLPHEFRQLAIFPGYISIILCLMWQLAVRAVLDSLFGNSEISTAFIAESI